MANADLFDVPLYYLLCCKRDLSALKVDIQSGVVTDSSEEVVDCAQQNIEKELERFKGVIQHEAGHLQENATSMKLEAVWHIGLLPTIAVLLLAKTYKMLMASYILSLPLSFLSSKVLERCVRRYREWQADEYVADDSLEAYLDFFKRYKLWDKIFFGSIESWTQIRTISHEKKKESMLNRFRRAIFSSHPSGKDRTKRLKERIAQRKKPISKLQDKYKEDRQEFIINMASFRPT